jgi:hypothetical protein
MFNYVANVFHFADLYFRPFTARQILLAANKVFVFLCTIRMF